MKLTLQETKAVITATHPSMDLHNSFANNGGRAYSSLAEKLVMSAKSRLEQDDRPDFDPDTVKIHPAHETKGIDELTTRLRGKITFDLAKQLWAGRELNNPWAVGLIASTLSDSERSRYFASTGINGNQLWFTSYPGADVVYSVFTIPVTEESDSETAYSDFQLQLLQNFDAMNRGGVRDLESLIDEMIAAVNKVYFSVTISKDQYLESQTALVVKAIGMKRVRDFSPS